jgi:2-polyprenyl-3-methyl-5-hydroxy-6-metoxy-1,4-benzoquinol methylase
VDDEKLTEKEYWDYRYKDGSDEGGQAKSLRARIFDKYFSKIGLGYPHYLLFDVFCRQYFPEGKLKIIEIGSAPGRNLLTVNRKFGYDIYGVEYTESGVEENRQSFNANNIDEKNVIHADFFDDNFQAQYANHFDIVMSLGFMEHFSDPEAVVEKHLNLLKPGGLLLIAMPNLRGINHLLFLFFAKHTIEMHNTEIMKKKEFLSLFDPAAVEILKFRFYGTLNCSTIYGTNKPPLKLKLMHLMLNLQKILDIFLYKLFPRGGLDGQLISPYMCIFCRKKAPGQTATNSN